LLFRISLRSVKSDVELTVRHQDRHFPNIGVGIGGRFTF